MNHKCVDPLYAETGRKMRKRRRKKVPVADRHTFGARSKPTRSGRLASCLTGRLMGGIKCLTIVDACHTRGCGHRAGTGHKRLGSDAHSELAGREQGLPQAIRTYNSEEFCGKSMLTWAHSRGVRLFLIEQYKPNQNAYIESFNGLFRDEA